MTVVPHSPLLAPDPDTLVATLLRPGMHVHCAITPARPNALIYALARVFAGQGTLTVSIASVHSSAHALALSGAVRRIITSFLGEIYPAPRPSPLYADLSGGRPFEVELWSLFSLVQRSLAAAQGLPYALTRSLSGSDLGADGDLHVVPDPVHPDQNLTLLPALRPDVTLVHGVCADRRGNIVLVPPLGEGPWSALAARTGVVATVERIVPDAVLARYADRVVIPGQRVLGLCEARQGAHPQALRTGAVAGVPGYLDDDDFLREAGARCRDAASAAGWFADWVDLPGGHDEYLRRLAARPVPALRSPPTIGADQPASDPERLIVLTARAIVDRVRNDGYDTLFAGIGAAHLAAWLASDVLAALGHQVRVCAEIGLYGMHPEPGDPFLFSQAHVARCEGLTGIVESLGGMVAANTGRCLGVLSAAEVDQQGAVNTTRLADGRWLTGSGGANDIASTVDCVVAAVATPQRFVSRVAHVTTPGGRVREVVSHVGRFRRGGDGRFRLATWLPPVEGASASATVAALTAWPASPNPPQTEPEIDPGELARLREFDPDGHFR
ncbi:CoA-transferase [Micromonospora sp. HUAS LYJ1]|uniref:CoA-transferase n=1 Tax=Micromonospora sp. HUAS LYJ1 TaxID=3061626 RepID=UPI0026722A28|nr:CoA-transferase [Micromonospora sp. HUAS LYJ1]WKU02989.1 CoA-transferase [Micromonospora sp. HUAS LYJ1]